MKRTKAESTDTLILLFLLLVTSGFTFTYHTGKQSGTIKAAGKNLPNHPSCSQINRRIKNIVIDGSRSSELEDDDLIIAVDSTGIKVTNRCQWMPDKWETQNKKKAILKSTLP